MHRHHGLRRCNQREADRFVEARAGDVQVGVPSRLQALEGIEGKLFGRNRIRDFRGARFDPAAVRRDDGQRGTRPTAQDPEIDPDRLMLRECLEVPVLVCHGLSTSKFCFPAQRDLLSSTRRAVDACTHPVPSLQAETMGRTGHGQRARAPGDGPCRWQRTMGCFGDEFRL